MLERDIESKVCKYAKGRGWLCFKFTSPANRAVPDRVFFKDGVCLFIEFKAKGKKPTKLQAHVHRKLHSHGFTVHVIDNIEDGKAVFDE